MRYRAHSVIGLSRGSTAVAMDVYLYDGEGGRIDVGVYDADGMALGYANVEPAVGETQTFVGVIAPAPIARIALTATAGGAFIDNLRFNSGDVVFANGFEAAAP